MARFALSLLVAALLSMFGAGVASAAPGDLRLYPVSGAAPLELQPQAGGYAGRITIENRGSSAVTVDSIELRDGPDEDPRLPPGVEAAFSDGASKATLAPGQSKHVDVRWVPPTPAVARQLFGQVLVHVNGETQPARAVGFHAELPGASPLGGHVLSWLLLVPLFGLVGVVALQLFGLKKLRALHWVGIAVGLAQLAVGLAAYAAFDPTLSRYDGNDGFQMIERARLLPGLGIEGAFGVDGTSLALVLLVPALLLAASLWSYSVDRALVRHWTLLLVLDAALVGAFIALDLALFCAFLLIALASTVWLLAASGARRTAAYKLGTVAVIAFALLLSCVLYLSSHAGPAYLPDGRLAPRALSIIDLYHADFAVSLGRILGHRAIKVVWSALFVAFAMLAAAFPLHAWLDDAVERAPAPVALMVTGALPALGLYGVVRLCFDVLPHGAGWAASTVVVVGVASMLHAGLTALVQTELRRLVACAARFWTGVALVGLGSLTAIGIQGALAAVVLQGLSAALLVGVAAALDDRVESTRIADFGGLARELPLLALVAAAGFAAALGAPGTSGFVPALMAIVAAAVRSPLLSLLAAAAVVPVALAGMRAFARLFLGEMPPRWHDSVFLEPHGGRFPRLAPRERWALVPLALLVIVLGLWPRPVLRLLDASSLDHASRVNPPGPTQIVRRALRQPPRLAAR